MSAVSNSGGSSVAPARPPHPSAALVQEVAAAAERAALVRFAKIHRAVVPQAREMKVKGTTIYLVHPGSVPSGPNKTYPTIVLSTLREIQTLARGASVVLEYPGDAEYIGLYLTTTDPLRDLKGYVPPKPRASDCEF